MITIITIALVVLLLAVMVLFYKIGDLYQELDAVEEYLMEIDNDIFELEVKCKKKNGK